MGARLKKPDNPKERNLVKGALRRVFSRSELRRRVVAKSQIQHTDPTRPRVTKWSVCSECKGKVPTYQIEVDHVEPIIAVTETLEALTWDAVVDRIWCNEENLRAICQPCHRLKTKAENKARREYKKKRGKNG